MSQLPNNSASFPPALPTPDSFGQTFHKHNYETDGTTTHLNVNNDNAGVWTGGIGGFQFSTINSTLTAPIKIFDVNADRAILDKLLKSTDQKTILNLQSPNNSLSLTDSTNTLNSTVEPTQVVLRDYTNNTQNYINANRMIVNDGNLSTSSTVNAGLLQIGNPTDLTTISYENIAVGKRDGTYSITIEDNQLTMKNNVDGIQLGWQSGNSYVFTPANNTISRQYAGLLQQGNNTDVSNLSVLSLTINDRADIDTSILTKSRLNITNTTTSKTSILTASDLTFNTVSLPTTVSTNTTNIATNTTNITKNTQAISKLQYANPINMANSPTIYGTLPSSPPMIPTTNAINTGFNGWYYRNISTAYNNISWSMGFQPSSYVVSNLKGFYFTFVSLTTTSKPFMSVYTLPATAPNFYLSRRSYVPAIAPATITAGIPYIYYYMYDNAYPTPFKYCHTAVPLTLSGVNPVGAFGANELLYFMSINTNSISAVNTEELIISEAGVIIDDGTGTLIQPFSFNSANIYSPNSLRATQQASGTITPTIVNNGQIYIATANFTISNAGLSGVPAGYFIIVQGSIAERTITYNTNQNKTVYTNTAVMNAGQVIFYWLGDTFVAYN